MDTILLTVGLLIAAGCAAAGVLWLMRWRADQKREQDLVFLQILTPKKESKEDKETTSEQFSSGQDFKEVVGVMDHLYQSLYGIYDHHYSRFFHGQHFLSLEYAALGGGILFFI